MPRLSIFSLVLIAALAFTAPSAAVPPLVNFQGKLTDSSGVPVPDASYGIRFRIYSAPSGGNTDPCTGTCHWEEMQVISTRNGIYSVLLGSVTPLTPDVFSSPEGFLAIKVGSEPEMVPRHQMASVPYAFKAGSDSTGSASDGFYGDGLDGDATISTDVVLDRDMYYHDLVIGDGISLDTSGYRVFVNGTLTRVGNGKMVRNGLNGGSGGNGEGNNNVGSAGPGGFGGAALQSHTLFGCVAGASGGAGGNGLANTNDGAFGSAGNVGGTITSAVGQPGGAGASGGNGGGGASGNIGLGGAGGGPGSFAAATYVPRTAQLIVLGNIVAGGADYVRANGSFGGSGGGGSGINQIVFSCYGGLGGGGGGNGSDGGVVIVAAKRLALNNAHPLIEARGGNGGNGGDGSPASCLSGGSAGGGGGGAAGRGGSGGFVGLVYDELASGEIAISVSGGAGGTPGNPGPGCGQFGSPGAGGGLGQNGLTGVQITIER